MIDLLTLSEAKEDLAVLTDARDALIARKITQASAIVLNHITTDPDEWILDSTASPVTYDIPADIQAATSLILGSLIENREAGADSVNISSAGWLTDGVVRLLRSYRDPTLG